MLQGGSDFRCITEVLPTDRLVPNEKWHAGFSLQWRLWEFVKVILLFTLGGSPACSVSTTPPLNNNFFFILPSIQESSSGISKHETQKLNVWLPL